MTNLLEGFLGTSVEGKKSRVPAQLDFVQSATGLFLGLFMWGHMCFVSTVLISKDFNDKVAKAFEGSMFFDEPKPIIVSFIVLFIFIVFIVQAILGMRKLPANFRQWQAYRTHTCMMKHSDTTLWLVQAVTGIALFFLGSVDLGMMMFQPETIDPYGSADRMYSDFMWPFYLLLLVAVEFHGVIGLYRLCVKWGWFEGKNAKESREKLKKVRNFLIAFFTAFGLITMAVEIKNGYGHRDKAGERYKRVSDAALFVKNIA